MAKEAVELLNVKPGGTYVDCTLGGGGHAFNIKCQMSNVKLIAIDQDPEAIAAAKECLAGQPDVEYINDNFVNLDKIIKSPVDGFLFDLGVSSHQLDAPRRGFSLRHDGPLDMRMDNRQVLTAQALIERSSEEALTEIFFKFGEERHSRRIARAIKRAQPTTTLQLKTVIEQALPGWQKRESVARIFQALRIAVNDELRALNSALTLAINLLKSGGRIVVISYHSLEDRLVKQTFRNNLDVKVLTKKPLRPTLAETTANPRAQSAKLRAAEKL
jgi:16S rRNA (cytosine1402-N4)-methyltransferase